MSLESYSVSQAAKIIGRSTKRVRQMITENKLTPTPDTHPLQIPAQQIHEMREQLKKPGLHTGQGTGLTFEQVKELVETFTRKALESGLEAQSQANDRQQLHTQRLETELETEREKVRDLERQLLETQTKKRGIFRR